MLNESNCRVIAKVTEWQKNPWPSWTSYQCPRRRSRRRSCQWCRVQRSLGGKSLSAGVQGLGSSFQWEGIDHQPNLYLWNPFMTNLDFRRLIDRFQILNSGSIASWRRWPFSATRRKWARRMAQWGEHLMFCLDKSLRWNTRKGWGGSEALRPSTALPSSSIWLLRLFFVELQLIKNHVPSRTMLLNTGARAGWERSQRLEGQKDLSAPSAACHQVKT